MSTRPSEAMKPMAEECARLIVAGSRDRDRIAWLRRALATRHASETERDGGVTRDESGLVGIWRQQPLTDGRGCFARDERYAHDFMNWADVRCFPPKSGRTRIAFLGESVARGYLYDPFFTPAACLEQLLNAHAKDGQFEVFDLARISMGIEELTRLCTSCRAMEPDAIVLFAGNNWRRSLFVLSDREAAEVDASAQGDDRFDKIEAILNRRLQKLIGELMASLEDTADRLAIPVIVIVPETNLKDWRSSAADRVLCWANGSTGRWLELKKAAEAALGGHDHEKAQMAARNMVALNRANPLGHEILAALTLEAGMYREARACFEAARDTCIFRQGPPPVITTFIQRQLRQRCASRGFEIVDLPVIFEAYLAGKVPGDDLFLDYCHLTVEGIHLAMKHTASRLLSVTRNEDVAAESQDGMVSGPGGLVTGRAHFYAAVHSAHMGQPYERLHRCCARALGASAGLSAMLARYIDVATRKVPWVFNRHFEGLLSEQYSILRQFDDCTILDYELVQAMLDALESVGIDLREATGKLRISEHQPTEGRSVELTETYYRETSYFNLMTHAESLETGTYETARKAYISLREPTTPFFLIADGTNDVNLRMTFRTAAAGADTRLRVKVNGHSLAETCGARTWQDLRFTVPKGVLEAGGVNLVEVDWPLIDGCEDEIKAEYGRKFAGNDLVVQKSRPVYADILTFTAAR